ncbi:MAG: MarR family transcriptional regulator [Bacteroidia bacterium]|nr:MarR family transcriptional regulator [Bacteroidia bacterium]
MRIEDEIKQSKPFKSDYQKAAVNMLFTQGWIMEHMRNLFQPFNITVKQYNILRILKGAGKPISTSVIRERLIDKMSDTTRIIDRMLAKGLVEKNNCKSDKRLVDITISNKGTELLKQIESKSKDMDRIFSALTLDETKKLNLLLDKLRG